MNPIGRSINMFHAEHAIKSEQTFYDAITYANYLLYQHPYPKLHLPEGDVHIWCAPTDKFLCQIDMLYKKLSTDEKKRADRFYREQDKNRYIICRGILRSILSRYLGVEPLQLQFCYGKYGKPGLSSGCHPQGFKFNLSHSNGIALYGFVRDGEIGIDIEQIRNLPEMEQIVERVFSGTEKKVFSLLPGNRKKAFFFHIWTRKESILKGTGDGFHYPPDRFDVLSETAVFSEPASGYLNSLAQWHIRKLPFPSGYAAAYSVKKYKEVAK